MADDLGKAIGRQKEDTDLLNTQWNASDVNYYFIYQQENIPIKFWELTVEVRSPAGFKLGTSELGSLTPLGAGGVVWTEHVSKTFDDDSLIVVDNGLNEIRDWLNGDTATAPAYIGVGTDNTPETSGDYQLNEEVFPDTTGRISATVTRDSNIITYTATFDTSDFNTTSVTTKECGLFNTVGKIITIDTTKGGEVGIELNIT